MVTTGAICRAKLQSNHHHEQTNIQFFTGRMPFLSPNQQCQSTEGENITFHGFAYPKHRSVVSYLFAYFCPFTAWTWLGDKRSMWPEAFYRPHIKNMPLQSSVVVQTMHNQK